MIPDESMTINRSYQTLGRNSCSIVSGDVSHCSYQLTVGPTSSHEFASQFGLAFFIREKRPKTFAKSESRASVC